MAAQQLVSERSAEHKKELEKLHRESDQKAAQLLQEANAARDELETVQKQSASKDARVG